GARHFLVTAGQNLGAAVDATALDRLESARQNGTRAAPARGAWLAVGGLRAERQAATTHHSGIGGRAAAVDEERRAAEHRGPGSGRARVNIFVAIATGIAGNRG